MQAGLPAAGFVCIRHNTERSKRMSKQKTRIAAAAVLSFLSTVALAGHTPIHERHELMEDVGKAAKPIGQMLKGEAAYDVDVFMASLATFESASQKFGELFPEGSETGEDTEAAPAIWEDRAGFDEALAAWADAVGAAVTAKPATLEEAKPVAGGIFKTCKGCHDTYRIDTD